MRDLNRFLSNYRSTGHHNLLSLRGGKWNIPKASWKEFIALYTEASWGFNASTAPSLVVRDHSERQPLRVDVDLRFESEEDCMVTSSHFSEFAQQLSRLLVEMEGTPKVRYALVHKSKGYHKTIAKKTVFTSGCHVYFLHPGVLQSFGQAFTVRAQKLAEERFLPLGALPGEMVDPRISAKRSNGLLLVNDFKHSRNGAFTGGRYEIREVAECSIHGPSDEPATSFSKPDTHNLMTLLYPPATSEPTATPAPALPAPEPATLPSFRIMNPRVDVGELLRITGGAPPKSHAMWCAIVYYLASSGGTLKDINLLEEAWNNKGAYPKGESHRLFRSYQETKAAHTKGSVMSFLSENAVEEYQLTTVFPDKAFQYYCENSLFYASYGRVHELSTLEQFCRDTIRFSCDQKKFLYSTRCWEYDSKDARMLVPRLKITDKQPFGDDNLVVLVKRKKEEVLVLLDKMLPKGNSTALLERKQEVEDWKRRVLEGELQEVVKEAGIRPKEMSMRKVFQRQFELAFVPRHRSFTFKPFYGEDPTPPEQFNAFQGFSVLAHTVQSGYKFDWEGSLTRAYLWKTLGNQEEDRYNDILNLLTFKVQNPSVRFGRLVLLISKEEGLGKSFFFKILTALLGKDLCAWYNTFSEFDDTNNTSSANRLVQWLDDISSVTHKQVRDLFARITAEFSRFNQKFEKPYTCPVFDDLWASSNDQCPMYTSMDDRRLLFIRCYPYFLRDTVFFGKLNRELTDFDFRRSFFDMVANRDIGDFNPISQDIFAKEKTEMKVHSLKSTYRFFLDFFVDEDWLTRFNYGASEYWLSAYEVSTDGEIRLKKDRLLQLYRAWCKAEGGKPVKSSTFTNDALDLGAVVKERQYNPYRKGVRRTVVLLVPATIRKTIMKKLPGFTAPKWSVEHSDSLCNITARMNTYTEAIRQ